MKQPFYRHLLSNCGRVAFFIGAILLLTIAISFERGFTQERPPVVLANESTISQAHGTIRNSPSERQKGLVEQEDQSVFVPVISSWTPSFCRFGVNVNTLGDSVEKDMNNYDIASLNIGWYINYSFTPSYSSPTVEHAPMIRLTQVNTDTYRYSPSAAQIAEIVEVNSGADWFVSNEPDRKSFQDGISPPVYAEAYHELYHLIKDLDPEAQIFAGSIVQPTEIRLRYLDLILAHYEETYGEPMPVDGWSIHNFILNEASCDHYNDLSICWGADIPPGIDAVDGLRIGIDQHHDIELFKAQILRFRNWMKDNGYTGKPVYLSEYGVLLPDWYRPSVDFSPERINEFMTASFDYMLNTKDSILGDPADDYRLIQRFSWYSINDDYKAGSPYIYNGNLFHPTDLHPNDPDLIVFPRSTMGDNYAGYTGNLQPEVDLYPLSITATTTDTTETISQTIKLQAVLANSGNLSNQVVTTAAFYNGDPKNGGQQIGAQQPISITGCGDTERIEVLWNDVPQGSYEIYVQVDGPNNLSETNESNNLISIDLTVSPGTVTVP